MATPKEQHDARRNARTTGTSRHAADAMRGPMAPPPGPSADGRAASGSDVAPDRDAVDGRPDGSRGG